VVESSVQKGASMASMKSAVAKAVRAARVSARLTQAQLGALLGVQGRAVCRWELGRSRVPRPRRARLLAALSTGEPSAAATLARALAAEDPFWAKRFGPAPTPAPLPPPTEAAARAAVERAVREAADHADVAASRLRTALRVLFEQLAADGVGPERAAGMVLAGVEKERRREREREREEKGG
jgi:transcriptional regulator with XRE-family HTH domain